MVWWFCAENIGAERWCECGGSGAQPVAAGDCGRDEGEREKDDGGVDEGEQPLGEGGPDERGLEPGVRELPLSSCCATHSDGCRRRGCATCPSLATGSFRTPVAGGAPGSEGFAFLRRGGSGATALGEGVPATDGGGAGAGSGDWAPCGGVATSLCQETSRDL